MPPQLSLALFLHGALSQWCSTVSRRLTTLTANSIMLAHLKISAIAVGLLILTSASVVAFFVGAPSIEWVVSTDNRALGVVVVLALFSLHVGGYLAAGYCSAAIAGSQPLLHGAICGLVGAALSVNLGVTWLFAMILDVPAAIAGAWFRKKRKGG